MKTNDERYWLRRGDGPWREVDQQGFVDAESAAGFHPKPGCGPVATGGFSSSRGGVEGRVTYGNPAKHYQHDKDFITAVTVANEKTRDPKKT